MALYKYIKTYPKSRRKKMPSVIPYVFITCGVVLMTWVIWPIVTFNGHLASAKMPSPQNSDSMLVSPLSAIVMASDDTTSQVSRTDFTNPNVWFPNQPQQKIVTPVNSYTLSIPKLRIHDSTVIIAGDSLEKSLIHYGGTGLPGQYGNTVIFGHSTLPQFYDPNNYKTIFSLLPTLKATHEDILGDKIFLTYDGITYTYVVYEMEVSKPDDLSALEQKYDDSYVTLITCVPPGTYWQRLHVKAKLVPLK